LAIRKITLKRNFMLFATPYFFNARIARFMTAQTKSPPFRHPDANYLE